MKALQLRYPATARGPQVDDYHGTPIADPYRWLEDPNAEATKVWVDAQNGVTRPFLDSLPHREAIKTRVTDLLNFEKIGLPWRKGKRYFWTRNSGLQNQSVLYWATSPKSKSPKVLIDPNTLSTDGTVALSTYSVSPDGKYLAYAISRSGSDWQEFYVREIATGKDLSDHLVWAKFTGANWSHDSKGFYYGRYPAPEAGGELDSSNVNQKLYFHTIGTEQSQDTLVFERPDRPELGSNGGVTEDGKYLILSCHEGFATNMLFVIDLANPGTVLELFNLEDGKYDFVDNIGSTFYFKTDNKASRGRVVRVDLAKWTPGTAPEMVDIIPEAEETIESVVILDRDNFVVSYLKDAHTQVRIFDLEGKHLRDVTFPGLGTVGGFYGTRKSWVTYYTFTSFNTPGTAYKYNLRTDETTLHNQPQLKFDPNEYVTEQVFYTSKDGTRVPMFICYRKGLERNGQNPTYLYGYGGFNVNLTPGFSSGILAWMEMGGIFAQPNLRGGGEYGEAWHEAGTQLKKQNVFDDFIAAAEWLIANNYTSTPKLAIGGGSNGGLLVGACMTQRPELYAAALPAVGVLDMLRFHKFTIGSRWSSDYGNADNAEQFRALLAYSPVHNVRGGTKYPMTMVTTGDHDDRVVPAHSYKFIAELQRAQAEDGPPVLIRIETKAGHGAGKPTAKVIEEIADRWGFLLEALGATPRFDS